MSAGPNQIKCKPETIDAILQAISKGIPYKKACLARGVSERLFYMWLERGEKDILNGVDSDVSSLVMSLNAIEEKRIHYNLKRVEEGEQGHKGAQWVLERVFWRYFSPKVAEIELNQRVEALEKKRGDVDAEEKEEKNNS